MGWNVWGDLQEVSGCRFIFLLLNVNLILSMFLGSSSPKASFYLGPELSKSSSTFEISFLLHEAVRVSCDDLQVLAYKQENNFCNPSSAYSS